MLTSLIPPYDSSVTALADITFFLLHLLLNMIICFSLLLPSVPDIVTLSIRIFTFPEIFLLEYRLQTQCPSPESCATVSTNQQIA